MNTSIKKKGRIAMAWLIIITMVFATMSTPYAKAATTLDVHGIVKVGAQTQYIIPAENDFVFIKQATADKKTYVLWTRDTLTVAEQHLIIDKLITNLPGGDKSIFDLYVDKKDHSKGIQYDLIQYFSGFGKIDITPKSGAPYSYTFSQNEAGQIILDNSASKISHIYYGQYNQSFELSVIKNVTMNKGIDGADNSIDGINGSVFVALYKNLSPSGIYSGLIGIKRIMIHDGQTVTPATFAVPTIGTYYVVEVTSLTDETPVTAPGTMFGKHLVGVNNPAATGIVVNATGSNVATITNDLEYNPHGSGTIQVNKILNGKDLTKGMFEFELIEMNSDFSAPLDGGYTDTAVNEAATAGAPGLVQFTPIPYEETGIHYYTIKEVKGSDPTITYDESVINVTMTVSLDQEENLMGHPSYSSEVPTFTNTFKEKEYGEISVTKNVEIPDTGVEFTKSYDFYAGIFDADDNLLEQYGDGGLLTLKVDPTASLSTTGTFKNLELDMTYYIYETDKKGNIIEIDEDGIVTSPEIPWKSIEYKDNEDIQLNSDTKTATVTIQNIYESEDFPLFGSITVNKTVTVDGKAFASNRTFYVALFADKELTDMVSEVKPLKMNGNSSTTTEFLTDIDGNPLEAGMTYYIAETDKDGVPLTGSFKELGFEIQIDNAKIVITEEGTNVNIINKFKSEEFPLEEFPLTGDNSNTSLWLFLAMLGVAGALAPFAFRKKEEAND